MEHKTPLVRERIGRNESLVIGRYHAMWFSWHDIYCFVLFLTLLLGIIIIILSSYSRKSRVVGFLVPSAGLIKVLPPRVGRIAEIRAVEGMHVNQGDTLALIDVASVSAVGRIPDLSIENLSSRRFLLHQELGRLETINGGEVDRLDVSIKGIKAQIAIGNAELSGRLRLLALSENLSSRNASLEARGVYSLAQREKAEYDKEVIRVDINALQKSMAIMESDLQQTAIQRRSIIEKQANEKSSLMRALSEIEYLSVQVEEQRVHIVKAGVSGTVTRITASEGSLTDPTLPLMTIVPNKGKLLANLYVPSGAAGFVKLGALVLLRYEAYPFQKFGVHAASVSSISRTSVNSKELPFPLTSDEPMYLVMAELAKDSISAYGKDEILQPGAKFQADLILDKRKLWEWAIEPLIAAKHSL